MGNHYGGRNWQFGTALPPSSRGARAVEDVVGEERQHVRVDLLRGLRPAPRAADVLRERLRAHLGGSQPLSQGLQEG